MEVNNLSEKHDGEGTLSSTAAAPSLDGFQKKIDGPLKKKRRRGKSKRNVMKPFMKIPWQDRKRNDKTKRNRFRKLAVTKTHAPAPFNNNQFLMEIHKPEPENDFQILQTPSARTRDSSFSVDSEENYFYSLPEDEEDFLTKEFSSVYEDAQSERLSNMSKTELIQEYLLLEAKYDALVKRTERAKPKQTDENTAVDKEDMVTENETSPSEDQSTQDEPSVMECLSRLKEQDEKLNELKVANEKLQVENEHLRLKSKCVSSEDSESDSSSTSISCSSSSRSESPVNGMEEERFEEPTNVVENHNGMNGLNENDDSEPEPILVNGNHDPGE